MELDPWSGETQEKGHTHVKYVTYLPCNARHNISVIKAKSSDPKVKNHYQERRTVEYTEISVEELVVKDSICTEESPPPSAPAMGSDVVTLELPFTTWEKSVVP